MGKVACIFGSTGLVGSQLVLCLLEDLRYEKILLFNRNLQPTTDQKIQQIVGNYDLLNQFASQLQADEYYCCLGTTIKIAKTKAAFEYVDLELPLSIGKMAVENQISKLLVVSSIGASSKSNNFYLNVKGRMEDGLAKLGIKSLHFFKPSMLLGKRNQSRPGESAGKVIMKIFGFLLIGKLKKYRAIEALTVAKAMIKVANSTEFKSFIESDEIQQLG